MHKLATLLARGLLNPRIARQSFPSAISFTVQKQEIRLIKTFARTENMSNDLSGLFYGESGKIFFNPVFK